VLRIARLVLAVLVAALAVGVGAYRVRWHDWPWQGDPARLSLCGRDYDPAPGHHTLRRADIRSARLRVEYRVPWLVGREVLSTRTSRGLRHPPRGGAACNGDLYLRVGADRYKEYELSGGP
jgi:hypothetical protein